MKAGHGSSDGRPRNGVEQPNVDDMLRIYEYRKSMADESPNAGSGYPVGQARPASGATARTKGEDRSGQHTGSEQLSSKMAQSEGSTISLSFPDSSSEGSTERCKARTEVINWDDVRLGHQIQPYRGYAHCADDIHLLSRFLELCQLSDIDGEAVKLLLRALKFLRLCDYSVEDICSIMAHTSAYFLDAYKLCGEHMDRSEVGNVLATLMFVAHCYVQDETCPLHVWHQHLFRKYCPLKTLNAAIIRLLEIRQYVLRLESEDLNKRFTFLRSSLRFGLANGTVASRDVRDGSSVLGGQRGAASGGRSGQVGLPYQL